MCWNFYVYLLMLLFEFACLDRMSDTMPKYMSSKMPERVSNRMPDGVSNRMPHKLSKYMPDRMPERHVR